MRTLQKLLALLLAAALLAALSGCDALTDLTDLPGNLLPGDTQSQDPQPEEEPDGETPGEGTPEEESPVQDPEEPSPGEDSETPEEPTQEESVQDPETPEENPQEPDAEEDPAPVPEWDQDGLTKVAVIAAGTETSGWPMDETVSQACEEFCLASDLEFQCYYPQEESLQARVEQVDRAVADGYNVLVMAGGWFGQVLVERSGQYPEVRFLALDVWEGDILSAALGEEYDGNPDHWDVTRYYNTTNVTCTAYQEEISGYLAGYAAVSMGYEQLGLLERPEGSPVSRFAAGFLQGADAAADWLGVTDQVTVQYTQIQGDPRAVLDSWYGELGVQVVAACDGLDEAAALSAAQWGGKVIGLDGDRAAALNQAAGAAVTLTSAEKELYSVTQSLLDQILLEDGWVIYAGQIQTLGLVSGMDPEENLVRLPLESTEWNDGFSQEDYEGLVARLYDRDLTVSGDTSACPEVSITVEMEN